MPKAVLTFHAITDVCFVSAVHTCVFLALTGHTHCFRGGGPDGTGREQGRGGGGETTDTKNYLEVRKQKSKDGPGTHQSQ